MEIQLNEKGIQIDGEYRVLLASSLFYFRIPRERWDRRMKLLRTAGYNTIDVYFPWNYHETSPGVWDFEENRDVAHFLRLAAENKLFVIARPGPYICSEWDGGAIPAWLYTGGAAYDAACDRRDGGAYEGAGQGSVQVRQDDPAFLAAMYAWYSHILPVLSEYQITKNGTVICMQVENELDFYDCKSPVTYMGKLKKMAESFGMEVPLFYCCGQDDIVKSGGLTEGLFSSFNVYAPGDCRELEARAMQLYSAAALRRQPFMITETNREHDWLKRLLASGAKLLGPYNQTAGTTMDFYTGITNWGPKDAPVAIMATDYDFKSLIGSAGNYGEEMIRARLFSGLVYTFGEALGCGIPRKSAIKVSCSGASTVIPELVTDRGTFLALSNLSERQTASAVLQGRTYELELGPCETRLLPVDVCISDRVTLQFATYEIASVLQENGSTVVWMYGSGKASITVLADGKEELFELEQPEDGTGICVGDVEFRLGSGRYVSEHGLPFLPELAVTPGEQEESIPEVRAEVFGCSMEAENRVAAAVRPMEAYGQYRGVGIYETVLPEKGTYLLSGLADLVTITQGDCVETAYCNGSTRVGTYENGTLQVMTEIWGHANFDDIRVKSLRMGSLKGMQTLLHVLRTEDLTSGWRGYEVTEWPGETCCFRHSPYHALMNADGFNRAASPLMTLICRTIHSPEGEDGLFLHFEKAECMITVYINNRKAAQVVKDDPYVDLSEYAGRGDLELTLHVCRRYYTDEMGRVTLYGGRKVDACTYGSAVPVRGEKTETPLPVHLCEGEHRMVEVSADVCDGDDLKLFFSGRNVKLTVYAGNHVMGRIYLSDNPVPMVGGGTCNTTFIPGEWLRKEPVKIWCQAIGEAAELREITMKRYRNVVAGENV